MFTHQELQLHLLKGKQKAVDALLTGHPLFLLSGRSRGEALGACPLPLHPCSLILGKKEEITEGGKAGRVIK